MAQIGTVKVQTASGPVEMPVYELSDKGSDVSDVVRVQTESGPGFIPFVPTSDADGPPVRIQHGSNVYQTHSQPSLIPDSGVFRLTFDDADTSGSTALDVWNDNDGTINGATTGQTGIAGYDGGDSYSFDGTDDNVTVPDITAARSSPLSLSAWVVLPNGLPSSSYPDIISKEGTNNNGVGWAAYFANDAAGIVWYIGDGTDNFNKTDVTAYDWTSPHFVTFTFDGSTPKIYVDANLEAQFSTGSLSTNTAEIRIGGGTNGYLDGRLDDPRVYDKVLDSTEVSNLYNTGSING